MTKQKNNKNRFKNYLRFTTIVWEMLVIIGAGTWGGVEIDKGRDADFPLFTVILSLLSVFIATYLVIKQVTNYSEDDDET
ncbi:MAG: AtpZ/AtpI family protein [Bacteroidales bacterium]|jgi:ATP synthase protein I